LGEGEAGGGGSGSLGKGSYGDPMDLANNEEACQRVMNVMKRDCAATRDILHRMREKLLALAVSRHGCRVVQKMTVDKLRPIIEKLEKAGAVVLARHRYGCRVWDCLLQRAGEEQCEAHLATMMDEIVKDAPALADHKHGNWVIQTLLKHSSTYRSKAVQMLLPHIPRLAVLITSSHVVEDMLQYGTAEEQESIAETFLAAESPYSLEQVDATKFGGYVVKVLLGLSVGSISTRVSQRISGACGVAV